MYHLTFTLVLHHTVTRLVYLARLRDRVIFCPVPVEVTYFEPERVGVELLNKTISTENEGRAAPMVPDLVHIGDMLAGVENVVDRLLQYVEDVMVSVGRRRRRRRRRRRCL